MEKIKKFWQKFPKIAKLEMLLLLTCMVVFRGAIWGAERYPEYRAHLWFLVVTTWFLAYVIFHELKNFYGGKNEQGES